MNPESRYFGQFMSDQPAQLSDWADALTGTPISSEDVASTSSSDSEDVASTSNKFIPHEPSRVAPDIVNDSGTGSEPTANIDPLIKEAPSNPEVPSGSQPQTIHTGDKPFQCHVCIKSYKNYCSLRQHIRIHTGDKPYSCDLCGKRFTQNEPLKRHIRTHTGDKPYLCDLCGKNFVEKGALTKHMRTHTGNQPYLCDFCDKRFRQRPGLTYHIKTKHPIPTISKA